MKRRKKKLSNRKFGRFLFYEIEKHHPAMMVLGPDDYDVLSKVEKAEANKLATAISESVFSKDKETYLRQLRGRFSGACMKKILMDIRPTDGWVGKMTVGAWKTC